MAMPIQIATELANGSSIGVIGGGPSGGFFTYYALDFANRLDLEIEIDIYEPKNFKKIGSGGCNHCGGIISESLVQQMATDGIVLPANIIQQGIDSYTMHTEEGVKVINTPGNMRRIASVFRGCGPRGCLEISRQGFDDFMLDICKTKGANVIHEKVLNLKRADDGIFLETGKSAPKKYDLIIGATGLSEKSFKLFEHVCPTYRPPELSRTYICEFLMEQKQIDDCFGHSMHVFLLDVPKITFGALIPKRDYVTMVLLGDDIDKEVVSSFVNAPEVKNCFPIDFPLEKSAPCKCYPFVNVQKAIHPFADRIAMIGDASSSKLYKNGIGAAFITGKAAASTAIFQGINQKSFSKYFAPVCRNLDRDNAAGKFIFAATKLIQKSSVLKRGVLGLIGREQMKGREHERSLAVGKLSSALWDTFTGSAGYRNILKRFLDPQLIAGLIGSTVYENLMYVKQQNYGK